MKMPPTYSQTCSCIVSLNCLQPCCSSLWVCWHSMVRSILRRVTALDSAVPVPLSLIQNIIRYRYVRMIFFLFKILNSRLSNLSLKITQLWSVEKDVHDILCNVYLYLLHEEDTFRIDVFWFNVCNVWTIEIISYIQHLCIMYSMMKVYFLQPRIFLS